VPGQAVYLTSNARGTPHSLRHNLLHNRVLHERVVLYTATFVKAPRVRAGDRFKVSKLRSDITRVVAHGCD
jgi:KUP system potassium uptake protein